MAKISVIMGIYNCSATLSESLDSLLSQTESDWNLIMCDDGSTDDTRKIALSYCQKWPEKMRLIFNEKNFGLNKTLNRCLQYADGKYIARQDGDDISLPTRFEKEVNVLEQHPEYAIVSTEMALFDSQGIWGRVKAIPYPEKHDFLLETPFCHAASMVRREAFDAVHGYTESSKFLRVEDYDLWVKMYAAGYRGMNITESLYEMRDDRDAASRRKLKYRVNEARVISKAVKCLNLPATGYVYALKPLLIGLLPNGVYQKMHHKRQY